MRIPHHPARLQTRRVTDVRAPTWHTVLHGQGEVRDGGGVELRLALALAHTLHAGGAVRHGHAVWGEVELRVSSWSAFGAWRTAFLLVLGYYCVHGCVGTEAFFLREGHKVGHYVESFAELYSN